MHIQDTENKDTVKIRVRFFTDPFCSWCWAAEPALFAIAEKYRGQIRFDYVFGGLVKDMDDFYDSANDISGAAAVMPHWKEVSERMGQPIDESVWKDIEHIRHFSSWPANTACKAAFLQSDKIGFAFLRKMKIALFTERKIISNEDVYNEIAQKTSGLDFERFKKDMKNGCAQEAFEEDMADCVKRNTRSFPTLLFYKADADLNKLTDENAVLLKGYRPIKNYEEVIRYLAPDIKSFEPRSEIELLSEYGPMTERELASVKNRSKEEELAVLEKYALSGELKKAERVRGSLWFTAQAGRR